MKFIVRIILFMALGFLFCRMGYNITTWEFWAGAIVVPILLQLSY